MVGTVKRTLEVIGTVTVFPDGSEFPLTNDRIELDPNLRPDV